MKILITFFLTLFLTLQTSVVFADGATSIVSHEPRPSYGKCDPGSSTPVLGLTNPLKYVSLDCLLQDIPNILITLAIIVFMIVFMIGGIKYMMSMGNEEATEKAKNTLTWGLIGLIVVLLAKSFMDWTAGNLPGLFIK